MVTLGSVKSSASNGAHSGEVGAQVSCSGFPISQVAGQEAHSLGPLLRSREGLRAVVSPPQGGMGEARGKGLNQLRSTRSISSSPSWFSAVSPVSQEPGVLLGTLVGEMPPQLVPLPPYSVELHGICLPAAENHTLH